MKLRYLLLTLLSFFSVNAVQVVENKPVIETAQNTTANLIAGAVIMGLGVGIAIGIIIFIIYWIVKKIKESNRRHSDLLYGHFLIELEKCKHNRDEKLKKRNWKTFFLTFKRADIYLDTIEDGLKYFGKYEGEVIQKDEFLLIATYRSTGIFTRERDIIIIPYIMRTLIKKDVRYKKYSMTIKAESIDETLNTDYYAQLVIKNPKDNDKLINFHEFIYDKYMTNYVHRQVLKDILLDSKDSVEKAVELNPNIQTERKNPKQ